MKRILILVIAATAIVGGVYFTRHSRSTLTAPSTKERRLAPDFTLPQLNGQQLTLSAYRGNVVLLDFWATWCVPCREEIPHFIALQQKYGDHGFQMIGVSMDDSADPVGPFNQQFHMNYPVVIGNAKIGGLYGGVLGLPIAFLIDRDGRVYAKHIGATNAAIFEKEISSLLTAH